MSQRDPGGPVQTCIARAEANLRMLLDIPQNYKVLFFQVCVTADSALLSASSFMRAPDRCFPLQGGAHAQFAAVPMNLFGKEHLLLRVLLLFMTGFSGCRPLAKPLPGCDTCLLHFCVETAQTVEVLATG